MYVIAHYRVIVYKIITHERNNTSNGIGISSLFEMRAYIDIWNIINIDVNKCYFRLFFFACMRLINYHGYGNGSRIRKIHISIHNTQLH